MGLPRSTYYDAPPVKTDDAEIVANITAICDEFEAYGYRRVGAELRHRGMVVNSKKIRRLMREHDLQPKRRRRFVATTDSDHDNPIFPDLARDRIVDGPNQLWVADITYIAIATRAEPIFECRTCQMSHTEEGAPPSKAGVKTEIGSWYLDEFGNPTREIKGRD